VIDLRLGNRLDGGHARLFDDECSHDLRIHALRLRE
jgi:hypothetical protein